MSTKAPTKTRINEIVAKQIKEAVAIKAKPIAKALTVKAPARTQTQEKTVTKAIKALEQPKFVTMTPEENREVEKKLNAVMKKSQTVMKKEITKASPRTPTQEKVITTVIKDLKNAKKTLTTDIKKLVKAKPVPKPTIKKVATKELLKDMESNIAKAVS